jgi:hypothetical protein
MLAASPSSWDLNTWRAESEAYGRRLAQKLGISPDEEDFIPL